MRKVSKLFLEIKRLKQIKIFKNRVEYMGDKKYLNKICNNKISKLGWVGDIIPYAIIDVWFV